LRLLSELTITILKLSCNFGENIRGGLASWIHRGIVPG
jgi:hypothetical protein